MNELKGRLVVVHREREPVGADWACLLRNDLEAVKSLCCFEIESTSDL